MDQARKTLNDSRINVNDYVTARMVFSLQFDKPLPLKFTESLGNTENVSFENHEYKTKFGKHID